MLGAIDQDLVAAARSLAPLLRAEGAAAEAAGRLTPVMVEALRDAGLLRMYVPRALGGLEADPVTVARTIEEVAAADSAAGWALMVASSVAWWCSRLPAAGPEEIYADGPDQVIAVAFHPPGRAVAVEGGFRVTGAAPLASNIHDARWLMLTALIHDGDEMRMVEGNPVAIGVIFPAAEAEILDTWHALGMRGTDSNDVSVADVFVPEARSFVISPVATQGPAYAGPLYRAPAAGVIASYLAPVSLAVARASIDEVRALAQGKTPFASSTTLRERAGTQGKIGEAEGVLRSARAFFFEQLAGMWERTQAGVVFTLEEKADLQLASTHAVLSAARAVELMYRAAGTTAIYTRHPLERHFRDVQVLRQHGFTNESRYETVGQVYLGLEPDLGLVAF